MSPRRVYLVWALLAVGLVGLLLGATGRWYMFEMQQEVVTDPADDDVPLPPVQFHTDFWVEGHVQAETFSGRAGGTDQFPHVAQVMESFRVFYLVGLVGVTAAGVGLLFRLRGLPDRKAFVATLAVFSIGSLVFAVGLFTVQIPDAYERELENGGQRPDLAFFTLADSDPQPDDPYPGAASRPGVGWYESILGIVALAAAFIIAYASDLRHARQVLTDDAAAARHYDRITRERDAIGIERFRKEGDR